MVVSVVHVQVLVSRDTSTSTAKLAPYSASHLVWQSTPDTQRSVVTSQISNVHVPPYESPSPPYG